MYSDDAIQNEIEDMLCDGENLRRQQSAIRHEEEDEQAEIAKIMRCESSVSRAELHKQLSRQFTSLSKRERDAKPSVNKRNETVNYYSDTSEDLTSSDDEKDTKDKPSISANNF